MKLFFMSDIHGSIGGLTEALAKAEEEAADHIVCLGDLLYHGPRNPLPKDYDPKGVAELLNTYKTCIVSVRGNCDAEVDQMLIEFPIMAEYAILMTPEFRIYATHGHHKSMDQLPPLNVGDVFIQGHTHVPVAEVRAGITVLNPGSVSLPKEGYPPSYGLLEGRRFQVKDFQGNVLKEIMV